MSTIAPGSGADALASAFGPSARSELLSSWASLGLPATLLGLAVFATYILSNAAPYTAGAKWFGQRGWGLRAYLWTAVAGAVCLAAAVVLWISWGAVVAAQIRPALLGTVLLTLCPMIALGAFWAVKLRAASYHQGLVRGTMLVALALFLAFLAMEITIIATGNVVVRDGTATFNTEYSYVATTWVALSANVVCACVAVFLITAPAQAGTLQGLLHTFLSVHKGGPAIPAARAAFQQAWRTATAAPLPASRKRNAAIAYGMSVAILTAYAVTNVLLAKSSASAGRFLGFTTACTLLLVDFLVLGCWLAGVLASPASVSLMLVGTRAAVISAGARYWLLGICIVYLILGLWLGYMTAQQLYHRLRARLAVEAASSASSSAVVQPEQVTAAVQNVQSPAAASPRSSSGAEADDGLEEVVQQHAATVSIPAVQFHGCFTPGNASADTSGRSRPSTPVSGGMGMLPLTNRALRAKLSAPAMLGLATVVFAALIAALAAVSVNDSNLPNLRVCMIDTCHEQWMFGVAAVSIVLASVAAQLAGRMFMGVSAASKDVGDEAVNLKRARKFAAACVAVTVAISLLASMLIWIPTKSRLVVALGAFLPLYVAVLAALYDQLRADDYDMYLTGGLGWSCARPRRALMDLAARTRQQASGTADENDDSGPAVVTNPVHVQASAQPNAAPAATRFCVPNWSASQWRNNLMLTGALLAVLLLCSMGAVAASGMRVAWIGWAIAAAVGAATLLAFTQAHYQNTLQLHAAQVCSVVLAAGVHIGLHAYLIVYYAGQDSSMGQGVAAASLLLIPAIATHAILLAAWQDNGWRTMPARSTMIGLGIAQLAVIAAAVLLRVFQPEWAPTLLVLVLDIAGVAWFAVFLYYKRHGDFLPQRAKLAIAALVVLLIAAGLVMSVIEVAVRNNRTAGAAWFSLAWLAVMACGLAAAGVRLASQGAWQSEVTAGSGALRHGVLWVPPTLWPVYSLRREAATASPAGKWVALGAASLVGVGAWGLAAALLLTPVYVGVIVLEGAKVALIIAAMTLAARSHGRLAAALDLMATVAARRAHADGNAALAGAAAAADKQDASKPEAEQLCVSTGGVYDSVAMAVKVSMTELSLQAHPATVASPEPSAGSAAAPSMPTGPTLQAAEGAVVKVHCMDLLPAIKVLVQAQQGLAVWAGKARAAQGEFWASLRESSPGKAMFVCAGEAAPDVQAAMQPVTDAATSALAARQAAAGANEAMLAATAHIYAAVILDGSQVQAEAAQAWYKLLEFVADAPLALLARALPTAPAAARALRLAWPVLSDRTPPAQDTDQRAALLPHAVPEIGAAPSAWVAEYFATAQPLQARHVQSPADLLAAVRRTAGPEAGAELQTAILHMRAVSDAVADAVAQEQARKRAEDEAAERRRAAIAAERERAAAAARAAAERERAQLEARAEAERQAAEAARERERAAAEAARRAAEAEARRQEEEEARREAERQAALKRAAEARAKAEAEARARAEAEERARAAAEAEQAERLAAERAAAEERARAAAEAEARAAAEAERARQAAEQARAEREAAAAARRAEEEADRARAAAEAQLAAAAAAAAATADAGITAEQLAQLVTRTGESVGAGGWEDPDFFGRVAIGDAARGEVDDGVWARPAQFCREDPLFTDGYDPSDICQGSLGDCWLISAISIVAAHPELMRQVFPIQETAKHGCYGVRLYKNGKWTPVLVDDRFPVQRNVFRYSDRFKSLYRGDWQAADPRQLRRLPAVAFAGSQSGSELWAMLLEKAIAKYYGSYSALNGGLVHTALVDLTGGVGQCVALQDEKPAIQDGSLWRKLLTWHESGFLIGCGSNAGSDSDTSKQGIVQGHAYAILRVVEVDDSRGSHKLLCLRNPWGSGEWKGKFSDHDTRSWTKRLMAKCDYDPAKADPDDGLFFMAWEDFLMEYRNIYLLRRFKPAGPGNPDGWHRYTVHGSWRGKTAGGAPMSTNVSTCAGSPTYLVQPTQPTDLFISLQQHERPGAGRNCFVHGFTLFDVGGKRVQRVFQGDLHSGWGPFGGMRELTQELHVEPSSKGPYSLVAATYEAGHEAAFTLTVYSRAPLQTSAPGVLDLLPDDAPVNG